MPTAADVFDRRLERIFRSLPPAALGEEGGEGLTPELLGLEEGAPRTTLAFGTYSAEGLTRALRSYGALARLEAKGTGPLTVRLALEDPYTPRISLVSAALPEPVVDLTLRLRAGASLGLSGGAGEARVLYLDDLVLQHPGRPFSWARPPLPHQRHPGLSVLPTVLQLLLLMARRIGAEGLALTPSSWHAAWVYRALFRFVDSHAQGRARAVAAAGRVRPLWVTAWAVALGCVRAADGTPWRYVPSAMLAPLSPRLQAWFHAPSWHAGVREALSPQLVLDMECVRQLFPWERMPASPPPPSVEVHLGRRPPSHPSA